MRALLKEEVLKRNVSIYSKPIFFLALEWVLEGLVHVTKLHVIEQVREIIANSKKIQKEVKSRDDIRLGLAANFLVKKQGVLKNS